MGQHKRHQVNRRHTELAAQDEAHDAKREHLQHAVQDDVQDGVVQIARRDGVELRVVLSIGQAVRNEHERCYIGQLVSTLTVCFAAMTLLP